MARIHRGVLALAAAVTAACQPRVGLPPPAELADRSEAIHEQVIANAALLKSGDAADHLRRLDSVLNAIHARYGGRSVELAQGFTDTGLLLIRRGKRYDLAEPYFERALRLSRDVFGTNHRETGYALHDLAVVRNEIAPEPFSTRFRPLLQEAIAVRRRVLGPGHEETAGSERTMAAFLFASWRRQARRDFRSRLLSEADHYVARALPTLEAALGGSQFEVIELRYLQVEIALAMRDFRRTVSTVFRAQGNSRSPRCWPWVGMRKPPRSGTQEH